MTVRIRVPHRLNSRVVIRPAESDSEIEAANNLVFRNYVAAGYWDDDIKNLTRNKWLHSPFREIFVATYDDHVVGTVSLIRESADGLPSDCFQPDWLHTLRCFGSRLAEVSALAIDKDQIGLKNVSLFLMKYYMQYAFYYTDVDRLIKACQPKHADFYADILRFQKVGKVVYNEYARRPSQLLSVDVIDAHRILSDYYGPHEVAGRNFYQFLLLDEHPNVRFPNRSKQYRSRARDWASYARLRYAMESKSSTAADGRLSVA